MKRELPPGQRIVTDWPVIRGGATPAIDLEGWRLEIRGQVEEEARWTWSDLMRLPQSESVSDMHSARGWSRRDNRWTGVTFREMLLRLRLKPDAAWVLLHGHDDYTAALPLSRLAAADVLLAHRHDGAPLSPEHGGPLRAVIPGLYLWKSVKWLRAVELLNKPWPGTREMGGFEGEADPWRAARAPS